MIGISAMKELSDYQRRYSEPSQTSKTELYSWILNTSLITVCKLHCENPYTKTQ